MVPDFDDPLVATVSEAEDYLMNAGIAKNDRPITRRNQRDRHPYPLLPAVFQSVGNNARGPTPNQCCVPRRSAEREVVQACSGQGFLREGYRHDSASAGAAPRNDLVTVQKRGTRVCHRANLTPKEVLGSTLAGLVYPRDGNADDSERE